MNARQYHVYQMSETDWVVARNYEEACEYYLTKLLGEENTPENRKEYITEGHKLSVSMMKGMEGRIEAGNDESELTTLYNLFTEMDPSEAPCIIWTTEY